MSVFDNSFAKLFNRALVIISSIYILRLSKVASTLHKPPCLFFVLFRFTYSLLISSLRNLEFLLVVGGIPCPCSQNGRITRYLRNT